MTKENMTLRGLIYMNPLVVDKIGKSFHYWKDSGFIFTKNLLSTFPHTYHLYWLLPESVMKKDLSWFYDAHPNLTLLPYPYSTSIHQNRYEFYGKTLKEFFPYGMDIDFIINNQPEVSANLMTWMNNQRRESPIMISFYHWLDCRKSRTFSQELGGYFWRQYDGYLNSDLSLFHGKYAYDLFWDEVVSNIKIPTVLPVSSFYPQGTSFGDSPIPLPDKKIILFNHRLNNTTRWQEVLDACENLYKNRQDFVLWMTDESKISFVKSSKNKYPFLRIESVPSTSYGYLLKQAHFAVCNHRGYSTWNMAVLDCFKSGCFCLVPDHADDVYVSMFDGGHDIFHSTDNLESRISECLDRSLGELQSDARSVFASHDYPMTEINIPEYIENEIKTRTPDCITKYENVKAFIQSDTSKTEWVNEFWSFHVNSNFQRIRWKLLQDGVVDDTKSSTPLYRTLST